MNTTQISFITIREGSVEEVVDLSRQIPEFKNPHPAEEYKKRLKNKPALILIAEIKGSPAGFKVGYQKRDDGSFYSWMGAVLPKYRKHGIAQKLADSQEKWAERRGYSKIRVKTRNCHKNMLNFALNNGFNIIEVIPHDTIEQNRIILEKKLL